MTYNKRNTNQITQQINLMPIIMVNKKYQLGLNTLKEMMKSQVSHPYTTNINITDNVNSNLQLQM